MNVLEAIEKRRAIKHFDPNHKLTEDEINTLINNVLLSPTAYNIQNWRFVFVQDNDLRSKIKEVAWGQAQVTDASLLVILCADLKAWEKNPERYWNHAPESVQEILVPAIKNYYVDKPQVQQDEGMRSCGMAAQTLMLTAQEMGYESCPMDGFDFDAVGKLINLPDDHAISMFVVIGKGIKEAWERGGKIPVDEAIIRDKF